ncbi:MAG TPA: S8 family peptidase, partial [Verrucomicrobiae bacterium]|nr:S8 family peptidase [Verrucomicrobiae bacterium]
MFVWSRLNINLQWIRRLSTASLLLVCGVLCFITRAEAAAAAPKAPSGRDLLIKFRATATAQQKSRALRNAADIQRPGQASGNKSSSVSSLNVAARKDTSVHLLRLKEGVPVNSEIARLQRNPSVEFVEPNYRLKIFTSSSTPVVPDDFEFSKMYALRNLGGGEAKTNADIHATEAWRFTTGKKSVLVAVIDTGIDYLHEDLRENIWINPGEIPFNGVDDDGNGYIDDYYGYDFVSNDSDPYDDNEHGTHVAGIIGAQGNNGLGTVGVCWDVSLMALKAFDDQGNGTVADAIAAIEYAVRNGARVVNASWGLDEKSRALEEAVQSASNAGVLFVAAAGNNRSDDPSYPASFDSVL